MAKPMTSIRPIFSFDVLHIRMWVIMPSGCSDEVWLLGAPSLIMPITNPCNGGNGMVADYRMLLRLERLDPSSLARL